MTSPYLTNPLRSEIDGAAAIERAKATGVSTRRKVGELHQIDVADAEAIARAERFIVCRFEGSGCYTKLDAATLDEARQKAAQLGPGRYTQRPMIYAISGGRSILVTATKGD